VSGPAVLTRKARTELRDAIRWIGADSLASARGLNDAVEVAARRIGINPAIGVRRLELAPERYRFWSIQRYPYILVYTGDTDPPRIVRIVHMARDLTKLLTKLDF
jgi:plasmid stabilization system protein ParE